MNGSLCRNNRGCKLLSADRPGRIFLSIHNVVDKNVKCSYSNGRILGCFLGNVKTSVRNPGSRDTPCGCLMAFGAIGNGHCSIVEVYETPARGVSTALALTVHFGTSPCCDCICGDVPNEDYFTRTRREKSRTTTM